MALKKSLQLGDVGYPNAYFRIVDISHDRITGQGLVVVAAWRDEETRHKNPGGFSLTSPPLPLEPARAQLRFTTFRPAGFPRDDGSLTASGELSLGWLYGLLKATPLLTGAEDC